MGPTSIPNSLGLKACLSPLNLARRGVAVRWEGPGFLILHLYHPPPFLAFPEWKGPQDALPWSRKVRSQILWLLRILTEHLLRAVLPCMHQDRNPTTARWVLLPGVPSLGGCILRLSQINSRHLKRTRGPGRHCYTWAEGRLALKIW